MSIYDVMSMDGIVSKRQLKSEQKCNKEYIMSVLNEGENIYPLICDELKKDDDIAKIAIQMNYTNNYSVYRKLVFNPSLEMMLLALKKFPYNIFPREYIYEIIFYSSRYNKYKKTIFSSNFIHNKQKSDFFEFIENPDLPIEQNTFNGPDMEKYNASLTSKGEIIISMCISELFKEHINHYEICEAIVKANGQFFSYLDYKYHQDKNLALIAVKSNGLIYQSLSEELKKDDEIIFHALMNDFIVYNFLPKEHKRNKDLMRKIFVHKGIDLLAENKDQMTNSSQIPEKASIEDYTDFLMIGIYAPRRKYVVLFVEEKLAEKIENDRDFFGDESPSDFIHEQGILFEEFKESVIGTFWLDYGFYINHHGITVNYKTLNKSGHISMESNGDPKDKTHISLNRSLDSEIKSLIDEHNIPSNFHHLIIYDEISYNAHLVLGLPLEEELNKPLKIILYEDAVMVNDYKLSEDSNLIDLMHTDDRITDSTYLQSIDGIFYAELEEKY